MELLLDFTKLGKNDIPFAGGKGASLGEMIRAGIPVPPGFVILTSAFEKFLEKTDLNVEIDSILHSVNHKEIHTIENASKKIKALILGAEIPKDIVREIQKFFKKLNSKYVAVRSSATTEDSASAAWAGQLESYLNTTEENLLENVKKCWASLFTPRAIFYRFEKDLHKQKISVAVVVQKMVESEKSGIVFSVHPVTQDRNQLIIEAGFGLGEAIVSGQITPDSYVVEKQPRRIIDKNVQTQLKGLYRAEKGGNEWRNIPKKQGKKQVLSDDEILQLSELILKIENHYDFPCDIEWAFECSKFYILQSRPITTLKIAPQPQGEKEWVFMFGTAPILPSYYASALAAKERADLFSPQTIFQYFDGSIISVYYPRADIERWKDESKKFLDRNYFEQYFTKYKSEIAEWWKWIRRIEKEDYSKAKRLKLKKDLEDFAKYQRDAIAYFGTSRPEFTFAAEQKLEELIKRYYNDEWPNVFGILTTPSEADDIQKEYLDWLFIISKDKVGDETFLNHASKYPWLVFGQFDDEKVIEFLRGRMDEEKSTYAEEVARAQEHKIHIQDKQSEIYHKLGIDSDEAKYLATFLQTQAVERMNVKSFWAGSYFLSRKLWKKIAEELKIPLWDLLMFITIPEIVDLLDKIFPEKIDEIIADRKKAYAIDFQPGGKIKILGSKEAQFLYKERIKKVQLGVEGVIRGQTASLGIYRGRVRKVIPGDLEMLKDSIKLFQKGEVLVTTMTQPNMMVIAQKAGAIITDEGGITSHAAIIARELKIPCIVGCLHAMEVLNDGEEIEVDANSGVVKVFRKKS